MGDDEERRGGIDAWGHLDVGFMHVEFLDYLSGIGIVFSLIHIVASLYAFFLLSFSFSFVFGEDFCCPV